MTAINWQEILTLLGGNAVILIPGVSWPIKVLVSNRLARDLEKFKIEVKASSDTEIERARAFFTRASHVHERQVDTLTKLYRHFFDAQTYLQGVAATVRFEHEVPEDKLQCLFAEAIKLARETFSDGRLLIPSELTQQCDQFFNSLFEGHMHLDFARHPMIADGAERARFWDKAKLTAYQEVPAILQKIDQIARNVIHGESESH